MPPFQNRPAYHGLHRGQPKCRPVGLDDAVLRYEDVRSNLMTKTLGWMMRWLFLRIVFWWCSRPWTSAISAVTDKQRSLCILRITDSPGGSQLSGWGAVHLSISFQDRCCSSSSRSVAASCLSCCNVNTFRLTLC